jgi:hypothetical protein
MCSPRLVFVPLGHTARRDGGCMNSQEAAGSPCQERDFWEMGPGACEGGGGREIWIVAPLGVNAVAPPRWPMGKKTGRALCHNARRSRLLEDAFDDRALRHESRSACNVDGHARCAIRALRFPWGILGSPARSGRASLPGVAGGCLFRMRRKSPVPSSLSQDRTTKRRGLRPARCHAALLVLSRCHEKVESVAA